MSDPASDTTRSIVLAIPPPAPLAAAGVRASAAASRRAFADYRQRLAENTRERHDDELALFGAFLADAGTPLAYSLADEPDAWQGCTWGLVEAFRVWLLDEGYAIGTINGALSTVRVYAALASKAGTIAPTELLLIAGVRGYRGSEGRHVDQDRETTRKGTKKAQWTPISREQAARLKNDHPDTLLGRRDTLLMCLLLDHGLRIGEIHGLQVAALDLRRGTLTFYREKVDKTQTHRLSADAARAALVYLQEGGPSSGQLLVGSRPGKGWGVRNMQLRVAQLGRAVGLDPLSPHDCRHYWATVASRNGTPIKALQDAGGWASPNMALRYAESAAIANDGVKLD